MTTPTDEVLAAAVEKIAAAVHASLPKYKDAISDLVRILTDHEWVKLKIDEDRRRVRNADLAIASTDAAIIDLHDVVAQLSAFVKIKRDLDYRLPGNGRPLANIALTRKQCLELLALYEIGEGEEIAKGGVS
jgi:hypothetical protein